MNPLVALAAIFVSVALIAVALLQVKGTSAGLFGSSSSPFRTRRGFEKRLFQATIALALAFVAISFLNARLFT